MALNKTKTKSSAKARKSPAKTEAAGKKAKPSKTEPAKKRPEEKTVKSQGISELIIEKRKLNQESSKWLKIDAVVSIVVCVALMFLAVGVVSSKRTEVFFQVNPQGQIKELTPIYMPKHSNAFVGDWLNKCLVDTFDFSYVNYQKRLTEVTNNCYSPEGRKSLENALIKTGNLEAVTSKRLYVSLTLDYSPVVMREMKPNAASEPYRWVLQSEGVITLQSATSNDPNRVKVTVVVSRSSMENSGKGLAIDRIIIK